MQGHVACVLPRAVNTRFRSTLVYFSLTLRVELVVFAVRRTIFAESCTTVLPLTMRNCQTSKNSRQSARGLVFDRLNSYVLRTRARVPRERLAA